MKIFLAGATGAIGRRLVPLLLREGHAVTGATRSADRADALRRAGVTPVIVDVFDAAAIEAALLAAQSDIAIHQLTDLPQVLDPATMGEALRHNARLRIEGTRNLMRAAQAADVERAVVQSIAFCYAPGDEPHDETAPLNTGAEGAGKVTVEGVIALEDHALETPGIAGVVLRFGRLYGPGTWSASPDGAAPLHIDAAAQATVLALTKAAPGIYNIAEEDGAVSSAKARAAFGFDPGFRIAERA